MSAERAACIVGRLVDVGRDLGVNSSIVTLEIAKDQHVTVSGLSDEVAKQCAAWLYENVRLELSPEGVA